MLTSAFNMAGVRNKQWKQIFLVDVHGCAILFCRERQGAEGVGVPGADNLDG